MKFCKLHHILVENNSFSSFEYSPPNDKLQLLTDFYLATYPFGAGKKETIWPYTDIGQTITKKLEEVKEKIVNTVWKDVKDASFFALCSEFRHITDQSDLPNVIKPFLKKHGFTPAQIKSLYRLDYDVVDNDDLEDYVKKNIPSELSNETERLLAYKLFSKEFDPKKLVATMRDAFENLHWNSFFGGDSWAQIADAWLNLDKSNTTEQKIMTIDHLLDLQHNTGSILNKTRSYYDTNSRYQWLGTFLSFKRRVTSPWQLWNHASPDMKALAAAAAHASGEGAADKGGEDTKEDYDLAKMFCIHHLDYPHRWFVPLVGDRTAKKTKEFVKKYKDSFNWKRFHPIAAYEIINNNPYLSALFIDADVDGLDPKKVREKIDGWGADRHYVYSFLKEMLSSNKYRKFMKDAGL